jgi:hypothetical protein
MDDLLLSIHARRKNRSGPARLIEVLALTMVGKSFQ